MKKKFVSISANTGYLLETYSSASGLTDEFYQICQDNIGKSKRYLSNDLYDGVYNAKWKMMVPGTKAYLKNGGDVVDDRI